MFPRLRAFRGYIEYIPRLPFRGHSWGSHMCRRLAFLTFVLASLVPAVFLAQAKAPADDRLEALKKEVASKVDARAKMAQEMVDTVFSFGELGFQEIETSRYLT